MTNESAHKNVQKGILLAILATIIWSGNFVVARGMNHSIPPITMAFYRWLTATIIIAPFAYRSFINEKEIFIKNWRYFVIISFFGITVYNTLIYVAGTTLPAINLALLGTSSSPVMSIILAAFFLKETIKPLRFIGLMICLTGILLLLSKGSMDRLLNFHFSAGDGWILLAALCFAIYNVMVRKKPAGLSPVTFLFITFFLGLIMLFPAYLVEYNVTPPMDWSLSKLLVIGYLGLGNSVLSFLFWNTSITNLGAGRTALFGNLITIFSSLEAVYVLNEKFTIIHFISSILVIGGLILANIQFKKRYNA